MVETVIDSFTGEYEFLSNYYPCTVQYKGIEYQSSEAAYQAQKCADPAACNEFIGLTADEAKKKGREVKIREDWDIIKKRVMVDVLITKFKQHPELVKRLIDTGNAQLIEGNTWGDIYWGICEGVGQNLLGEILQKMRTAAQRGWFEEKDEL